MLKRILLVGTVILLFLTSPILAISADCPATTLAALVKCPRPTSQEAQTGKYCNMAVVSIALSQNIPKNIIESGIGESAKLSMAQKAGQTTTVWATYHILV